MSDEYERSAAHESTHAGPHTAAPIRSLGATALTLHTPALSALLSSPNIRGAANGPVRQAAIQRMQQTYGNQATRRYLQRSADPTTVPAHAASVTPTPIQRIGEPLTAAAKIAPANGETAGKQRRYGVDQYIAMWEAEQGRKMTDDEKQTVARGCIAITALNLSGGGNPPLDRCYSTFAKAETEMTKENAKLAVLRSVPIVGAAYQDHTAVLFAKMFWSNQNADEKKRKKADPKAFKANKNGQVDMSKYKYEARPGFINFDYAFWDAASQSFWHANHSEPGMQVYQSTKEKFAVGYKDFDRTIYCVAIATNYDPKKAVKP